MRTRMNPQVSVVIPLFNRAHRIAATLESVLAQSFQNFEVVIVDDGSSDDCHAAIEAVGDPRIRLVRQENEGASSARNRGVQEARGALVAFLDSDDRFLPHHLATMVGLLAAQPDTAAYTQVIADRGDNRTFVKPHRGIRDGEAMADYLVCRGGFVQTSTLVVPRSWALAVPYRTDVGFGDDTDIAIRLSLAGCRFVMAPTPGAVWSDERSTDRLSSSDAASRARFAWLDDLRGQISHRAYAGYCGWHVAKTLVRTEPLKAWRLYGKAVISGAYAPKLALRVALQLLLNGDGYRRLADRAVGRRRKTTA
ncbi:glycosyltransferase family 2 protein [Rhizobium sp. NFR03]|uniref:glycosyltransferase family 2 protein n=1 Tax=Rhizobium sp. NFR03 TaxID=1566263 RepID=UPI0008B17249|nr:glycosyltransferase family 2 protein [Rhizobium sp. NFR03]SES14695.1 Glycosyl transferase family 2 [Rhizobium sp. NFR03]